MHATSSQPSQDLIHGHTSCAHLHFPGKPSCSAWPSLNTQSCCVGLLHQAFLREALGEQIRQARCPYCGQQNIKEAHNNNMMNCWWVIEQLHSATQMSNQPLRSLDAEDLCWLDAGAADSTSATSVALRLWARGLLASTLGPGAASSIAMTDTLSIVV